VERKAIYHSIPIGSECIYSKNWVDEKHGLGGAWRFIILLEKSSFNIGLFVKSITFLNSSLFLLLLLLL
jgi:hypothetical protein